MVKTFIIMISIALLLVLSINASAGEVKPQMQMFLVSESPKPLAETVKVFKEEVVAGGWSILNITNMAGILSEKGFTLHPVLIFDI